MSAIVWLEINGVLKKCRVDGRAAEMLLTYGAAINRAYMHKDFEAVKSLSECRTEAAAHVVELGHYTVVDQ
jgi:hypothetical protein